MGSTSVPEHGRAAAPTVRGRWAVALALVVGLVAGLGTARLLAGRTLADGPRPPAVPSAAPSVGQAEPIVPLTAGERLPVEAATSPRSAVEGFLAAEAAGDFAASYAFLSAADREAHPTAAAWVAAHAQLPPVTGYAVEEVRDTAVVTLLGLRSTLDQVMGLIPARGRATWETVQEEGGWRVSHRSAALSPLYPPDDGVADAARRWAEARQSCAAQPTGSLIGAVSLAADLCGATGDLALGPPGVLDDGTQTTPLLNAYGPEVFTWARVVPVTAPVPMQVVLGPIADEWRVVGVLPEG
jgi:hypothetical protein